VRIGRGNLNRSVCAVRICIPCGKWKKCEISTEIEKAFFIRLVRSLISLRFSVISQEVCKKSIAVNAFFHQKQTFSLDGY